MRNPGLLPTLLLLSLLAACSTPPSRPDNLCEVFREKDDWYDDAMDSYEKWGVPVALQMAILHQESRFRSDAQPRRKRFLWIIPTFRPSSAYGYPQAVDGTWERYIKSSGNGGADRDDFEDATDFVGWYCHIAHQQLGIPKNDAFRQYLAYHEGFSGYRRRTYLGKRRLLKIARKVERQTQKYRRQLATCQGEFDRSWW